ncbi:MAG: hypothetical protein JNK26_01145 [Candidatus Doudnabacteria bacterium]|nr:hypothetical protein [Candidatus Doudnabacteria bacterium]
MKQNSRAAQLLNENRTYIIGMFMALTLLLANTYLGIYTLNLLLSQRSIDFVPGIALPEVNIESYEVVKQDLEARSSKSLPTPLQNDPFHTK